MSIIRKCIDELAKENPRLDYVRGMLEAYEEQNKPSESVFSYTVPSTSNVIVSPVPQVFTTSTSKDVDAGALDAVAAAKVAKLKDLVAKSQ